MIGMNIMDVATKGRTFYIGQTPARPPSEKGGGYPIDVYVDSRGHGKWVVANGTGYGSSIFSWQDGDFYLEPMPSNRSDEYIATTRYSFGRAWQLATNLVAGRDEDWPFSPDCDWAEPEKEHYKKSMQALDNLFDGS